MKCLKCGMENKEESKFCLNCGNNLEQQIQQNMQQPVQPQQMVNQPMYAQPAYNQQTKKSNKGLIIGLSVGGGVLLLIIIVVVIVFNFIHGAKKALDNIEVDDNITINGNDNKSDTKNDTKDDKKTSAYSIGDPVTLVDGSKWHVLEYDGKDNITLMLDELVVEETGYGKSAAAEDQKYENSLVKDYLENTYKPELEKSLKENGGTVKNLTVRTLKAEEFLEKSGESWGERCYYSVSHYGSIRYYIENGKFKEHYVYDGSKKLTDQDKFIATLALTGNFWTMSNIDERTNDECEAASENHGAYYIKPSSTEYDGNSFYSEARLSMDWEAYYTSSGGHVGNSGTSAGIRPVIETSIKNIKK